MPALTGIEAEAVRAFGVEPERIEPARNSRVNRHWFVQAGGGRLLLRQYGRGQSIAAIAWEHRLLDHARRRGWPVAAAIPGPRGATAANVDGGYFALFRSLPGEPRQGGGPARQQIAGRLLARLHLDLEGFEERGQREGFGRAWELDLFVRAAVGESFNGLLAAFSREHPEIAAAIRRERYRNLRELARLRYGELPGTPIHGDFRREHLLFSGAGVTGLLGFDLARRDAPAFDVATSLALDCLERPANDALDLQLAGAFLEGYARLRPLAETEAELIPALVRASMLWLAMVRLTEWQQAGEGAAQRRSRAVASLARAAERRLPALEARSPALLELALAAARR